MKTLMKYGLPFALYGVMTCVMFFPVIPHLSTHLLDAASGDPLLQVWVTQWTAHKLTTSLSGYFDANIFYPYVNTFAFHDHMFGVGILGLPIQLIAQNPILTFNALLLLSFLFSAYSMYVLAYDLCQRPFAAFLAGAMFGFLPYRFAHLDHLNLLCIYWLPLILLSATCYILKRATTIRPLTGAIALFYGAYLLQVLTSFNYLFMTTVVVALYGVSLIALTWKFDAVIFKTALRRDALPVLIGGGIVAGVLLPLTLPYLQANREMGFERTSEEIAGLSATPSNYLAAPANNLLYGNATKRWRSRMSPYPQEQMLFPGLLPMLLAAATLPLCWRQRGSFNAPLQAVVRSVWLLLCCAFVLSLGAKTVLFGREVSLPYAYLYDYLPGFKSMRVPARFGLIVAFCIAILAAVAIARLAKWVQWHDRRRGFAVFYGICALGGLLLEYWPSQLELTPYPGTLERIPPVYAWLRQQPDARRIIELPMNSPNDQFDALYYSTFHWKQMVNGRSAFIPAGISRVFEEMRQFPSPRTLALLQSLKIDTVILHTDKLAQPLPDILPEEMQLIEQFGSDLAFRISPIAPSAEPRWNVAYRLPATLQANETYRIGVVLTPAAAQPISPLPQEQAAVRIVWKRGGKTVWQERRELPLPRLFEHGRSEIVPMRLATPEAPGQYDVSLHLDAQRFEPTSFTTQITLVQDAVDSRAPQKLQAEVLRLEYQRAASAGKTLSVKVEVRNSGDTLWRSRIARPQNHAGEVHFAVRDWHDAASRQSINRTAKLDLKPRGLLPYDVAPGETAVVAINIPTPRIPGTYRVECDFVSEFVQWFGQPILLHVTLE